MRQGSTDRQMINPTKALAALTLVAGWLGCAPSSKPTDEEPAPAKPQLHSLQAWDPSNTTSPDHRVLRATQLAKSQSDGIREKAYHVEQWRNVKSPANATRRLVAGNPTQRFAATFGDAGVRVAPANKEWELALEVTAIGCGGKVVSVGGVSASISMDANRVEYRRIAGEYRFSEWYVNGPLGIEQGFTLEEPPCADSGGTVSINVALSGLRARSSRDSRSEIQLVGANDQPRLHMTDLHAKDARGMDLPVKIVTRRGGLELAVDTRNVQYPVYVDPLIWSEQQELVASDTGMAYGFGSAVAVSGNTALVGAYGGTLGQPGAAYVFVRNGMVWFEQQKLTASDKAASQRFGWSVSLSGETALIGAFCAGSAYVFVRNGTSWTEQQKLVGYGDWAVSLSGDTAILGGYGDGGVLGSAHVLVRSGTSWTLQQRLEASDGRLNDRFGWSVAVSGDTALIGAIGDSSSPGSAYVFTRSGSTWTEMQKLVAGDGAAGDKFGHAVSISSGLAFVGAPGHASQGAGSGSVYAFTRGGTTWTQHQKLEASDGAAGAAFGWSVAASADAALIGAVGKGCVYAFTHNGTTWDQLQKIAEGPAVGWSTAMSGTTGLVGGSCGVLTGYDVPCSWSLSGGSASVHTFGLANGDPCSTATECASGSCSDGRCCDATCDGPCDACSIAAGASLDGKCAILPPGTQGSPLCAPLTCNGSSANCSACTTDAQCPTNDFCNAAGNCEKRRDQGTACDVRAGADCIDAGCRVCATGPCQTGECCDRVCSQSEVCAAVSKVSGPDGTCGEAKTAIAGSPCATGTTCTSGICSRDGVCCSTECNLATLACTAANKVSGPDGTCGEAKIAVSGAACSTGTTCTSNVCSRDGVCCSTECSLPALACAAANKASGPDGTCGEAKTAVAGFACTADSTCTSGHCSRDGICCDRECKADCESCRGDWTGGVDGVCGYIKAGTDPLPECEDNAACSVRPTCNGKGRCECQPAGASNCDTDGVSKVMSSGQTLDCSPYRCIEGDCLSKCTSGTDCAPGARCASDGRCVTAEPESTPGNDSGCGCRIAGRRGRGWGEVGLWLLAFGWISRPTWRFRSPFGRNRR